MWGGGSSSEQDAAGSFTVYFCSGPGSWPAKRKQQFRLDIQTRAVQQCRSATVTKYNSAENENVFNSAENHQFSALLRLIIFGTVVLRHC